MLKRKLSDCANNSDAHHGAAVRLAVAACTTADQVASTPYAPGTTGNQRPSSTSLSQLVSAEIGEELVAVEELLSRTLSSRHEVVQALAKRAAALGGKRLRPVLVLLFCRAAKDAQAGLSLRQLKDVRRAASAVELVHAASLVHDDVMDHATERRHQPTISHVCGNSQAVLLGDFLFTRAYAVAAQCASSMVARRLASAATQLCEGELRQQASAGDWRLSYRDYRSILTQKTGVLIGTGCRLGVGVTGADKSMQQAANRFGTAVGLAFQVFDDWLDYWGEGESVGKTLGTDLSQLKPTLPLMRLLRTSSYAERKRLVALLQASHLQADSRESVYREIRRALDRSDAGSYTLAAARRCVEQAKLQLRCFSESPSLDCIRAIADFSVQRKD